MKRYSIFHIPVFSFFSKALYREVCFRWKGTGFGYLLLLLMVCWVPPMLLLHERFSDFIDTEAPPIVSQIPVLSIVDGKASLEAPQPYRIMNPETGETLVVLDTTGTIASLEEAKAIGLITETQAIFQKSEVETQTFSFRNIEQFTLTPDKITGWLATAQKIAVPVLYPFAVLVSFLARIIQLLVYAALGMLFASWCSCRRTYAELLRLSVVAVTPAILIKTVFQVAQIYLPFSGLWYFLLAMGYLFFAVRTTSPDESPVPAST